MPLKDYRCANAIIVDATVNIKPSDVAEMFWKMDASEMREFFNHLGKITDVGNTPALANQMMALITDKNEPSLDTDGRDALKEIATVIHYFDGADHA